MPYLVSMLSIVFTDDKEKQKLGMGTMLIRQMKIFVHMERLLFSISTPF